MTEDSKPPVPIGSSSTRFDRIDRATRAKVRVNRNGSIRAELEIGPYVVPEEGAEIVPFPAGVGSEDGGKGGER